MMHDRLIGSIEPYASEGNAVAGHSVEVWGTADEFGGLVDGYL